MAILRKTQKLDEDLEKRVQDMLADERYFDHPMRDVLQQLWCSVGWQLVRLERITKISDRYQNVARERVRLLSRRYDRQIRLLERVLRISDRYQSMLKELNVALHEASTHDLLTGIANRRLMSECCRQADERSIAEGSTYSLVVLDADHFKLVNDTYGHEFGDRMLVELAQKFKSSIRHHDLCSRWGGEEFLGLFVDADLEEAEVVVQRLLTAVRSIALDCNGAEVGITASIGLAQHAPGETYADTFRRADEALLVAKRRGRDRYVIAP